MARKPGGVGIESIDINQLIDFGISKEFLPARSKDGAPPVIGSVLPDWAIRQFVTIDGFFDYDECPASTVSYGLSSCGYDVRVSGLFKIFTNVHTGVVSPKNIPEDAFITRDLSGHKWSRTGGTCYGCGVEQGSIKSRLRCEEIGNGATAESIFIPPNSFALAETVERLEIPRNINCLCLGKSTYARCGIITNFTPFEPGWRGTVTVEISNSTPNPVEIFAWQGIAQAQFQLMVGRPERAYSQKKNAKYQDQTGLTLPFVK